MHCHFVHGNFAFDRVARLWGTESDLPDLQNKVTPSPLLRYE